MLRRGHAGAEALELGGHREGLLDGLRQAAQGGDEGATAAVRGRVEGEAEHVEANELREVGLAGRDADLLAGPQVVGGVGDAGDAALGHVG